MSVQSGLGVRRVGGGRHGGRSGGHLLGVYGPVQVFHLCERCVAEHRSESCQQRGTERRLRLQCCDGAEFLPTGTSRIT